jgi:hypothetical protein
MVDPATMLDTDTSSGTVQEPIRLPQSRTLDTPPSNEVIIVDRALVTFILFTIILVVGAYALGWTMATSPGETGDAVRQAVATMVVGLPGPRSSNASAPTQLPFTRDPGQRFSATGHDIDLASLMSQVNPAEGYTLPVKFGKIGPQLIEAGAIDYNRFIQIYERAGQPLNQAQIAILTNGSETPVVVTAQNAYFLLNLFWALGLSNQNRILTDGPMMQYGKDQIGSFASTGGWTIGAKPVADLYSHSRLVTLTQEQQTRLETVAANVYRPCCQNPTLFPDCNHGMAMLGLLELMAAQDATTEAMFAAAKQVNAFWFPQQTLELATYFKGDQGLDFAQVEPRQAVGIDLFSSAGFRNVHQWLATNGLVEQVGSGGSRCGV